MSGSSFGRIFKITTFGESHGVGLGVVVDGCPAGIPLEEDIIQKELDRRRPGHHNGEFNAAVTARKEADACQILSGVFEGKTTGTPIALVIYNTSQHSKEHKQFLQFFHQFAFLGSQYSQQPLPNLPYQTQHIRQQLSMRIMPNLTYLSYQQVEAQPSLR